MSFYKYHALGNDYIVIDANRTPLDLTAERIRLICHRNFGIGSDGILYGPIFEADEITLKIFNPDGSEAEKAETASESLPNTFLMRSMSIKRFSPSKR